MSNTENVKQSTGKQARNFILWLSAGIIFILYSLWRISADQPLFRKHTRDLPAPRNEGGAYHADLLADDNRNPHYILIGIGVVFLLIGLYHLSVVTKRKKQLNTNR